jgi:hypothetical protein
MAGFHRFEDALPAWRVAARSASAGPVGPDDERRIVAACLAWMDRQGCWPNQTADMTRVAAEVQAAVHQLAVPLPEPATADNVRPSAWAVPAAAGAAVGALVVSPLTFLWFDNRSIGLFIGGTLGAFLAVRGLAALLDRPLLVSAIRSAASLSGGGVVLGGLWRAFRGQSVGWLRSGLWLAVAPLLLTVVRPWHKAERVPAAPGGRQIGAVQAADLALAVAWAHPDRMPPEAETLPTEPDRLPPAIWVSLTRLQAELARRGPGPDLRDACEDLFQRFQEDGYVWQSVSRGTPFSPETAAAFDAFGMLAPGQPVRTQRSAILRLGQVVQKGEIRRA